jgi:hypothetical protein
MGTNTCQFSGVDLMALKFDTSTELLSNIVVAVSRYDPLKKN